MDEVILARLELIAAKAKTLALDYKNGKLWPGDLDRNLDYIKSEINRIIGGPL